MLGPNIAIFRKVFSEHCNEPFDAKFDPCRAQHGGAESKSSSRQLAQLARPSAPERRTYAATRQCKTRHARALNFHRRVTSDRA